MAKQDGLFPLDTGDSIAAKSTRAQKVTYFLQHVVEPGAEEYLPKLLKVMRDSKVTNVVGLADDIHAATGLGINHLEGSTPYAIAVQATASDGRKNALRSEVSVITHAAGKSFNKIY